MTQVSVKLPFSRETPGALVYALPKVTDAVVANVYVRKDKLREAGYAGPWPKDITITVEVGA